MLAHGPSLVLSVVEERPAALLGCAVKIGAETKPLCQGIVRELFSPLTISVSRTFRQVSLY